MNIQELERRLVEEGCSRANYSIGYRDSDVFCLMKENGVWRVFYTERGQDQEPMIESESEEEACEFFFKYQTERIQHHHLVGYFRAPGQADALEANLVSHGLKTIRRQFPYHGWDDLRFQVFVIGKDIFKAQEILGGEPPLHDDPPEWIARQSEAGSKVDANESIPPKRRLSMSEDEFITNALAAIQKQDFEIIEGLRDQIKPAYVPRLVATWNKSMPWETKDAYVALLMDQTGEAVKSVMEDAWNSPTVESRAYALCILKGDFGIFDSLLTDGWLDRNKVDKAIQIFRSSTS